MADINYNKTTWVNGSTALNAANLNNIEIVVDSATKAINNKVDKEAGKGLSTHDFNDHYKNAIDNLQDVEANPSETGTEDLTKLKVGSTVYNIPSGGGSSVQFYKLSFNNIYLDSSNKYNITVYLSKSILDNLFSLAGLNLDNLKNNFSSYVGGQLLWGTMTDIVFSTFDDFYGRITIHNDSGEGANLSYFKDGTSYFNFGTTPITISFNTYSYNSSNTEATFNYEILNQ